MWASVHIGGPGDAVAAVYDKYILLGKYPLATWRAVVPGTVPTGGLLESRVPIPAQGFERQE